jgi:hypothetical protein
MRKQKNQSAVLPAAYLVPLILVVFSGIVGTTAVASRYPGLIELELKLGVNSGAVKIDGRSSSIALPPGKQ